MLVSCLQASSDRDAPPGVRTPVAGTAGAAANGTGGSGGAPAGAGGSFTAGVANGGAGVGGDGLGGAGTTGSGGAGSGAAGSGGASGQAGAAASGGAAGVGGTTGAGGSAGASAGAGGVPVDADGCPLVPALKLARVATLADSPMLLVQAPGDSRSFIAERSGRVRILRDGVIAAEAFLDIRAHIAPEETERGLLSIALHPTFAQNGRFYVVYTRAVDDSFTPGLTTVGDLVLAEGKVSTTDPDRADATLTALLTVPKTNRFHNGGMIAFGKDGKLFMSVGEDGCAYTPTLRPVLQKTDNRLGKLLRVDVDLPGTPPPGNFTDGDPYVWDYGFRNPWRLSVDRKTGDLYVGDLGEGSWEEINYEPFGQGRKNYGWPLAEGNHCTQNSPDCELASFAAPVHEFEHSGAGSVNGRCGYDDESAPLACNRAVVGGYVYRGSALPELDGRYFYGDFINNTVSSLIVKDGAATCHAMHETDLNSAETPIQGLASFSEDAAGELYLLDLLGNVYRIERE
ncbi:MAG TPA: PQQ-dependent sugar dehydrogenase [Polyangiaceae bacterium]